jgi:WD40 repeat protein
VQSGQGVVIATPLPDIPADDVDADTVNQEVDNSVTAIAMFPDGTKLAAGDEFGTIIIWDLESGEELARLLGHTDIISVLRFNEDGTQLLSGSKDRIIILWRIETDIQRSFQQRRFIGHTDRINDVDFNPDPIDNTIVSGSEDRSVILWDASTGEVLQILGEQSSPITTVQFTPEGDGVVLGTLDGRVIFKGIDSAEEIIQWAEDNRYVPELSCPQGEQYNVEVAGCNN